MNETAHEMTLEELKLEVKRRRLLKEIRDLQNEAGPISASALLDRDLKTAQLDKAKAEARVAERVTPLVESIKLISSLVIGIGGAIAGIAGFQFANAERKEAVVAKAQAEDQRQAALADAEKLKASQASLQIKNDRIGSVLDESAQVARKLHDDTAKLLYALSKLKAKVATDPELSRLIGEAQSRQLALTNSVYAANRTKIEQLTGRAIPPPSELVDEIFGDSVDVRLTAFEMLALFYRNDEKIIPLLVARASSDRKNLNGIYNAFAALSVMPSETLRKHRELIEPLLKVADQIGPRTQRKAAEISGLLTDPAQASASSAAKSP